MLYDVSNTSTASTLDPLPPQKPDESLNQVTASASTRMPHSG